MGQCSSRTRDPGEMSSGSTGGVLREQHDTSLTTQANTTATATVALETQAEGGQEVLPTAPPPPPSRRIGRVHGRDTVRVFFTELPDASVSRVVRNAAPDGFKDVRFEAIVADVVPAVSELRRGLKVVAPYPAMEPWLWDACVVGFTSDGLVDLVYADGDRSSVDPSVVRLRHLTWESELTEERLPAGEEVINVVAGISLYTHRGQSNFTRFARGVIGAAAEEEVAKQKETQEDKKRREKLPPPIPEDIIAAALSCGEEFAEWFICPITQDVMRDPVVAADGFTYERDAIERWFRERGDVKNSPMTNAPFAHAYLTPNLGIRSAILSSVSKYAKRGGDDVAVHNDRPSQPPDVGKESPRNNSESEKAPATTGDVLVEV